MAITESEFKEYITIMTTPENEYNYKNIERLISNYKNEDMRITRTDISEIKPDVDKINSIDAFFKGRPEELVSMKNIGNIYDTIMSNSDFANKTNYTVRSHLLDEYCFKPNLTYDHNCKISGDTKRFNTLYGAELAYINILNDLKIDGTYFNDFSQINSGVPARFTELLKSKKDKILVRPSSFIRYPYIKETVFEDSLDNTLTAILNNRLYEFDEDSINRFFRYLARINLKVIEDYLEKMNNKITKVIETEWNDMLTSVANLEFNRFEKIKSIPNLSWKNIKDDIKNIGNATIGNAGKVLESVGSGIGNMIMGTNKILEFYGVTLDEIYPGMFVDYALLILENVITSEYYNLNELSNIEVFSIYMAIKNSDSEFSKVFRVTDSNAMIREYNQLDVSAEEFRKKVYSQIRKSIISSEKFEYYDLENWDEYES